MVSIFETEEKWLDQSPADFFSEAAETEGKINESSDKGHLF